MGKRRSLNAERIHALEARVPAGPGIAQAGGATADSRLRLSFATTSVARLGSPVSKIRKSAEASSRESMSSSVLSVCGLSYPRRARTCRKAGPPGPADVGVGGFGASGDDHPGVLDQAGQTLQELRGQRAVDHPVVDRQG